MRAAPAALLGLGLLLLFVGASWLLLRPTPVAAEDEPLLRRALHDAARVERIEPETLRRTRWIGISRPGGAECVELRTNWTADPSGSRFCYERGTGVLVEERVMVGF